MSSQRCSAASCRTSFVDGTFPLAVCAYNRSKPQNSTRKTQKKRKLQPHCARQLRLVFFKIRIVTTSENSRASNSIRTNSKEEAGEAQARSPGQCEPASGSASRVQRPAPCHSCSN